MEYDSATTKEQSNAICSNMDATGEHHTKWSKSEKRQITWYHLHVKSRIQLKWAYLQSRNRPTNIEERFVVAKGRQEEERRTGNFRLVQFSSVQSLSCVWLCDPVNQCLVLVVCGFVWSLRIVKEDCVGQVKQARKTYLILLQWVSRLLQ